MRCDKWASLLKKATVASLPEKWQALSWFLFQAEGFALYSKDIFHALLFLVVPFAGKFLQGSESLVRAS